MAPETPESKDEEFSTPHLPERYQNVVKAKRQKRIRRNALVVIAAILVLAGLYLLFTGPDGVAVSLPSLHPDQMSVKGPADPAAVNVTTSAATGDLSSVRKGPGLSGTLPSGTIAPESALEQIRNTYPEPAYTVTGADFSTGRGRPLFEFTIHDNTAAGGPDIAACIDAVSGKPYSVGEEKAAIPRDAARNKAVSSNPGLSADRVLLDFSSSTDNGPVWNYVLYSGDRRAGVGTIDATTGELKAFARYPAPDGRSATAAIAVAKARTLAEHYIANHNGGQLPLNMSSVQYTPNPAGTGTVAGQYTFHFDRIYLDYPTDVDGFLVTVDAVTGEISGYSGQWTTQDYAFSVAYEPDVVRREATFAVMQRAMKEYPDAGSGLRIVSAELRWKNRVPYGTIPRPGTIPLGWKVIFDDDTIRANASAMPGIAWVDVQSGDFIEFSYRH